MLKTFFFALLLPLTALAQSDPPLATWPPAPLPPGGNSASHAEPRQEWIRRAISRGEAAQTSNQQKKIEILFDGDSITDWWQNAGKEIWNSRYAPLGAANLACASDMTQHLLWRLRAGQADGLDPKLIVLLIGTNNLNANSPEEITAGIKVIVAEYEKRCPKAKILLLGLFPRGSRADDGLWIKAKAVNALLQPAVKDDPRVTFMDLGDKFLEPGGNIAKELMPDFLHPSAQGYQRWADAIQPVIETHFPAAANPASPR